MTKSQRGFRTRRADARIEELRTSIREKVAVAELAHELGHQLNNPLEALTNLIYIAKIKLLTT